MAKVTAFQERVYAALCEVPAGKVTTYGDLARTLGINSAQAVGQALKHNPYAPSVPCHRVVASDGSIGGFMGSTDGIALKKKIELLRSEGVIVEQNRVRDFSRLRYRRGRRPRAKARPCSRQEFR